MKSMQLLSTLALGSALLLTACATPQESLNNARNNMSCGELAMKIGRLQEAKSQSNIDLAFDGIGAAASKSKGDATAAAVGGVFDAISQGTSDKRLQEYQAIYRQRGCH